MIVDFHVHADYINLGDIPPVTRPSGHKLLSGINWGEHRDSLLQLLEEARLLSNQPWWRCEAPLFQEAEAASWPALEM